MGDPWFQIDEFEAGMHEGAHPPTITLKEEPDMVNGAKKNTANASFKETATAEN